MLYQWSGCFSKQHALTKELILGKFLICFQFWLLFTFLFGEFGISFTSGDCVRYLINFLLLVITVVFRAPDEFRAHVATHHTWPISVLSNMSSQITPVPGEEKFSNHTANSG